MSVSRPILRLAGASLPAASVNGVSACQETPRLAGFGIYKKSQAEYPLLWLWNARLIIGMALLLGYSQEISAIEPTENTKVTKVIRNDIGELKWMLGEVAEYTPVQAAGRKIFQASGCPYCHSRVTSLETGETQRLEPVAQAGEYAVEQGFGPNLSQVGLKYGDDWHRAHYWNPRMVVPDSQMPRFTKFFDGPYGPVNIVDDDDGNRTLEKTAATEKLFDFASAEQILLTPNEDGLTYVRETGKYPIVHTPNDEYTGATVELIAGTQGLDNLIAYVQTLGVQRGKWRELSVAQQLEFNEMQFPESQEMIDYGKQVYQRRCIGCHGKTGNGNGPAATFLEVRPRNFQYALFKFRVTPTGSLPTDGDLLRTLTRGVRGTAMPSFHGVLSMKERVAAIQYVKNELAVDRFDPSEPYQYFVEEEPEPPFYLGFPPNPSAQVIAYGNKIWEKAKCWECHGRQGRGDGEKAAGLEDDFGYPIRPANLTRGLFKSGGNAKDIFRTITSGLNGTPMPSYADALADDERWALAYYVLSLSAFSDPITGEPLQISEADRTALNNPELQATESYIAYEPRADVCAHRLVSGLPMPQFCKRQGARGQTRQNN